jgi:hypothetical protein
MSNEKTIRMPKELLGKWLAALRSGEYRQAARKLELDGAYCCLGVLQHVANGDVERFPSGVACGLPTPGWLGGNKIEFLNAEGSEDNAPWLPTLHNFAQTLNDTGTTFIELADAIEACAEGV